MDVRVLRYFLTVAREGSITKAAEVLHLTQPTLSRQLMDLENELGTILFNRGNRNVTLTAAGILYQQRIQEIVALLDKADREVAEQEGVVRGTVSIGCVETTASLLLPDVIEAFNTKYPLVKYELYCANGDDIRDRIDSGHLDIGILVEPVETAKYESFPLPFQDVWGVLMRKDDPLAIRESIRVEDIADSPLFMSSRRIIKDEIESWFEENANSLNVLAHHNLVTNTMLLVERAVCIGMASCGTSVPLSLLVSRFFGQEDYPTIFGFYSMMASLASSISVPGMGAIYDMTGSYRLAWLIFLFTSVIIAVSLVGAELIHKKQQTNAETVMKKDNINLISEVK